MQFHTEWHKNRHRQFGPGGQLRFQLDGQGGHPVDDGDAMTLILHMPEAFVAPEDSEEARGRVAGGPLTLDYPTGDWVCLEKLSLS